jgi:hypothetical protein
MTNESYFSKIKDDIVTMSDEEILRLVNMFLEIAESFRVAKIPDAETGHVVKYLFYKPMLGKDWEERHEMKKEVCELPGADKFVITEDYGVS